MRGRRASAVVACGLGLVLVGFVFDAVPLFVPGVALAAIGALAPLWVWAAARGARVRRTLAAERIVEDEPLHAVVEVRRGLLGLPGAEVDDPLSGTRLPLSGPQTAEAGVAGAGRSLAVRVTARFARRGERVIAPPSLIARDPLDLARAHVRGGGPPQRLLVLPRTEPVRWSIAHRGRQLDRTEGDTASEAMAAIDLDGLRPYRRGTPASRIHWPAVARGQGFIERRLLADGDTRPLVVLDGRERDTVPAHPELLDAAVRAAGSLALDLGKRGGCALQLPGDQRPTVIDGDLLSWPAVYARLARVGTEIQPGRPGTAAGKQPTRPGGDRVTRAPAIAGGTTRTGPLIYVTAAATERLAAALASAGRGQVVLVVPEAELVDGRPRWARDRLAPVLEVAGCRGFAVGSRRRTGRPAAPSEARSR